MTGNSVGILLQLEIKKITFIIFPLDIIFLEGEESLDLFRIVRVQSWNLREHPPEVNYHEMTDVIDYGETAKGDSDKEEEKEAEDDDNDDDDDDDDDEDYKETNSTFK